MPGFFVNFRVARNSYKYQDLNIDTEIMWERASYGAPIPSELASLASEVADVLDTMKRVYLDSPQRNQTQFGAHFQELFRITVNGLRGSRGDGTNPDHAQARKDLDRLKAQVLHDAEPLRSEAL